MGEPFFMIDGEERCDTGRAVAKLLLAGVLGVNAFPFAYRAGHIAERGPTIMCFVIANDIWAWGSADAEYVTYSEIGPLYKAWKADRKWGVVKWLCAKRNEQPQPPIVAGMKADGAWDDALENLPANHSDAEVAAIFAKVARG